MMLELRNPVPVLTPAGPGYAMYVKDGGTWENDIWCVVMEQGGKVLHFRSDQIRMHHNSTFDLSKDPSWGAKKEPLEG